MVILTQDLREFIGLLNSHQVRYLIVGGHAVGYHGHPRTTGDLDFFVEVSEENARKLEAVLHDFGFGDLGLTAKEFLQPGIIIQLGYAPHRIDLLTFLTGVDFADAWEKRISEEVDGLPLLIIDRESLLANKAALGRPQDVADLDHLR